MQIITQFDSQTALENDNRIIAGTDFSMQESTIRFTGSNNLLFAEDGVRLDHMKIHFAGSGSIVYLSESRHPYPLHIDIYNDSVLFIGKNNYFNNNPLAPDTIILSEQKHVFIGDDGLFSFGIWMRTADPHLIYSRQSRQRLNPSRSIYIGDHVWVGQNALILKGTRIESDCIIGAMSVVSGKQIPANTAWAGNPSRQISSDIYWSRECVHAWNTKKAAGYQTCKVKELPFVHDSSSYIPFDQIEKALAPSVSPDEKLAYLQTLVREASPSRFVSAPKKRFPFMK